jgi:glutathione S-transferase
MRGLHRSHGNYALLPAVAASHLAAMDLYISPLSCSLAAHIALREAGIPVRTLRVDRKTKLLDDGSDYRDIATQGIVPALRLDDGAVLTECVAVLQYIADQVPERRLAPPWGTRERYRLVEWLSFCSTEVHKKHVWTVFSSKAPEASRSWAREGAGVPLAHAAAALQRSTWLLGESFTVADIYLFWCLLVAPHGGISLEAWPVLQAFVERVQARPACAAALAIELPLYQAEQARNAAAGAAAAPAVVSAT